MKESEMQVGQRVNATHYERTFSGVIESKRAISVKTDGCSEFFIRTDDGELELILARFDGAPSRYAAFSDRLELA